MAANTTTAKPDFGGGDLGLSLTAACADELSLKSVVVRTVLRSYPPPAKSESSLGKKRAWRSMCLAYFTGLHWEWVGLFIAGSFASYFAEPRPLHSFRDVNLVMWRRAVTPRQLNFLWELARRPRYGRQNKFLQPDDGSSLMSLRFGDLHVQVFGKRTDEGIFNHREAVDHWYFQQGEPHHVLGWTLHQVEGRLLSRYHFPSTATALPLRGGLARSQDGNQTEGGKSPVSLKQHCLRALEEDYFGATVTLWGREGQAEGEKKYDSQYGRCCARVIEIKLGHS